MLLYNVFKPLGHRAWLDAITKMFTSVVREYSEFTSEAHELKNMIGGGRIIS